MVAETHGAQGDPRSRQAADQAAQFDLDASGSRFTLRTAAAVAVDRQWMDRWERGQGTAESAIAADLGAEWLATDADLGEVRVLDGVRGRGAAAWIPVVEWLGLHAAEGLVGLAAGEAARAGIKRIRARIEAARKQGHRVMVSRGLAAALAMEYVFGTTEEKDVLHVEFVQEPSVLGGRDPSETSYTGLEPWVVSLVNAPRRMRYILVVGPEGDIEGCIATETGQFEPMFGLLPPTGN